MGAQICTTLIPSDQGEIPQDKPKLIIKGPPKIQKLEPIVRFNFIEDNPEVEKEKSQVFPKESTCDNTQSKQEELPKQEEQIQQSQDAININNFNELQEQSNNSKEDSSSALLEAKHKSILKNKMNDNKSPQNRDNESMSGSQRSIKKVTFDKKQKVVYSSFRKPKP